MAKCPICYKKSNYTTKCNHKFCKTCLYKWGKKTCPMCRGKIELKFPQTRAMVQKEAVFTFMRSAAIAMTNIKDMNLKQQKIEQLLEYIWKKRIVIRKKTSLCNTIRTLVNQMSLHLYPNIPDIFKTIQNL